METEASDLPLIKVIGVSAAGKSTLVAGLRRLGYNARPVSQEHSEVPDMWQRIRPPDWLIFLDLDLPGQRARRPDVSWDAAWRQMELDRLAQARSQADLRLDTGPLTPEEVLQRVAEFLQARGVAHAPGPLPALPRTGGVQPQ